MKKMRSTKTTPRARRAPAGPRLKKVAEQNRARAKAEDDWLENLLDLVALGVLGQR